MSSAKKTDLSSLSQSQLYEKCLREHTAVEDTIKQMRVFKFEISYLQEKQKMKEEELRTWLLDFLILTETRSKNDFDKYTSRLAEKLVLEHMDEQKREAEAEAEAKAK